MIFPTRSPAGARDPAGAPPRAATGSATIDRARAAAAAVLDPEVPVLTIEDLGVLREVDLDDEGGVTVTVTPTYSGCPAMEVIEHDVTEAVRAAGFERVTVRRVLSPAWTTDWMTAEGRRKLEDYGIAPPGAASHHDPVGVPVALTLSVRCPRCGSLDTRQTSRFGSTACKALWQCQSCREPFDHFKAI